MEADVLADGAIGAVTTLAEPVSKVAAVAFVIIASSCGRSLLDKGVSDVASLSGCMLLLIAGSSTLELRDDCSVEQMIA